MAKIEIYTKDYCSYCDQAKALLKSKGLAFTEIAVDRDPTKLSEMLQRSEGRRTVPQIFINNKGIGGYTDLKALVEQQKLNSLLGD